MVSRLMVPDRDRHGTCLTIMVSHTTCRLMVPDRDRHGTCLTIMVSHTMVSRLMVPDRDRHGTCLTIMVSHTTCRLMVPNSHQTQTSRAGSAQAATGPRPSNNYVCTCPSLPSVQTQTMATTQCTAAMDKTTYVATIRMLTATRRVTSWATRSTEVILTTTGTTTTTATKCITDFILVSQTFRVFSKSRSTCERAVVVQ